MKKILIIFLMVTGNLFAQEGQPGFSHMVMQARGDLNKDGIADLVVVTQDTLLDNAPYRMQVFFMDAKGAEKQVISSDQIIAAQFPNGRDGLRSEAGFDTISIKNNVLTISNQLTRGMFSHKFRYQNGDFELIGFTHLGSNGIGTRYETDFNLSTGICHYKEERSDTGEVITNRKEKKMIRPLPKLQDFIPFEMDF